jgi:hypothetical protein
VFRVAPGPGSIDDAARMAAWRTAIGVVLAAAALLATSSLAHARNPFAFYPPRPERLRAVRYADMSKQECLAELALRSIPHRAASATERKRASRVDAPVHLTGPIRSVRFELAHPSAPAAAPLLDCRLLLALDDLATIAGDRGIRAVRYNSILRRGWGKKGHRHPAGVAIDVVAFVRQDGELLDVLDDFRGNGIGSKTCGPGAAVPPAGKPKQLRELVCALHRESIFNLILSPHYDRRHKNHLHLEVRRGIKWFLTQ